MTHASDKILRINETAIHQLYNAEDFHNPIMFIILDLRTTTTIAKNPLMNSQGAPLKVVETKPDAAPASETYMKRGICERAMSNER